MRRRQQQQLKEEISQLDKSIENGEDVPTVNDPIATVPASVIEQAKKIREALTSGKAVCDGCMRIFSGKLGLKVHRGHGCKGRNG